MLLVYERNTDYEIVDSKTLNTTIAALPEQCGASTGLSIEKHIHGCGVYKLVSNNSGRDLPEHLNFDVTAIIGSLSGDC